jgi:hypothetical protein
MKFIKFGGTYYNIDKVSAIEIQRNTEGEVYLYLAMPNREDDVTLTTDITSHEGAELLNQKLFRFLNYKNSPGVFDLCKQTHDICKEDEEDD